MAAMDDMDLLNSNEDVNVSLSVPIQLPLSTGHSNMSGIFDCTESFDAQSPKFKSINSDMEFQVPHLSMSGAWASSSISSSNLSLSTVSSAIISPPLSTTAAANSHSAFIFGQSVASLHDSSSLGSTSSHVFDSLLSSKNDEESSLEMGMDGWNSVDRNDVENNESDGGFPSVDPQSVANMALENDHSQEVVFSTLPAFDEVKAASSHVDPLPSQTLLSTNSMASEPALLNSMHEVALLSDSLPALTEAERAIDQLLVESSSSASSDASSASPSSSPVSVDDMNSKEAAVADPLSALKSKLFSTATLPRKKKNAPPQGPSFGRRGRRPISEKEKQEYEARLIRESIDALTADIQNKNSQTLPAPLPTPTPQENQPQTQQQQPLPAQSQESTVAPVQQPPAPVAVTPVVPPPVASPPRPAVAAVAEEKKSNTMDVTPSNANCSDGEESDCGSSSRSSGAADSPRKKKKNRRGKNSNKSQRKRKLSSSSDECIQGNTAAISTVEMKVEKVEKVEKIEKVEKVEKLDEDGELDFMNLDCLDDFKLEDCEFATLTKAELAALTDDQRQEYKRIQRLQRNRASAQLSRERKKAYMRALEKQVRALSKVNTSLSTQISTLAEENAKLKKKLETPTVPGTEAKAKSASTPADNSPAIHSKGLEYSSSGSDNELSSPTSPDSMREEVDSDHAGSPAGGSAHSGPPEKKAKFDLREHPQLARMSAGLVMLSLLMAVSIFTSLGVDTTTRLPANFQATSGLLVQQQFAQQQPHQSRVLLALDSAEQQEKKEEDGASENVDTKANTPLPPLSPLSDMDSDDESKALALIGASSAKLAPSVSDQDTVNEMAIDIYNPNSAHMDDAKKILEEQQIHNLAVFKRLLSRNPLFFPSSAAFSNSNITKDENFSVNTAAYMFCPSAIHFAPPKSSMQAVVNESRPTVVKLENPAAENISNDATQRSAKRKKIVHGNEPLRKLSEAASVAANTEHAVAPLSSPSAALLPAAFAALGENAQAAFVLKKDDRLVLYFPSSAISEIDNATKSENGQGGNGRKEVIVEIGCLVESVTPIILSN